MCSKCVTWGGYADRCEALRLGERDRCAAIHEDEEVEELQSTMLIDMIKSGSLFRERRG